MPAGDRTRIRFVYYQPIEIDTAVGRYLYPLEDGGTDDLAAQSFWVTREKVDGTMSFEIELKSAAPVADVRLPGLEAEATIEALGPGHYRARFERQDASLDRDVVFYYRLDDHLPGRVEVIPYRADPSQPGTFMMVLTPGVDLGPLTGGSDYSFVLDVSGSMAGKIHTLAKAVSRAIGELRPEDRFRIVTFSNRARRFTRGWVQATPENVAETARQLAVLGPEGGTNLYAGLELGLADLDDDRATSVILVTDAVTNQGVLEPREFHKLMKQTDVRVFGFLLGNSANWPLMRTVCDATGGFWAQISNEDDILGQIVLAKSKVTHEALHDAEIRIRGVEVFDDTHRGDRQGLPRPAGRRLRPLPQTRARRGDPEGAADRPGPDLHDDRRLPRDRHRQPRARAALGAAPDRVLRGSDPGRPAAAKRAHRHQPPAGRRLPAGHRRDLDGGAHRRRLPGPRHRPAQPAPHRPRARGTAAAGAPQPIRSYRADQRAADVHRRGPLDRQRRLGRHRPADRRAGGAAQRRGAGKAATEPVAGGGDMAGA